ncbi:MAG: carboxypeptidase [Gemmatimonadetes bacterium]|nr:carboxypeptidase [Gemmatimonadota bacterium]
MVNPDSPDVLSDCDPGNDEADTGEQVGDTGDSGSFGDTGDSGSSWDTGEEDTAEPASTDLDGDGYDIENDGDCDDSEPDVWPGNQEICDGLDNDCDPTTDETSDVDGDGLILSMRMPDPGGGWKVSEQDARLLVPRRFHDTEGPFYRVFPEGLIHNYNGVEVGIAPARRGLDFNRNFPANWQPEVQQQGAGDYPFSEPEARAVAEFVTAHPNICGVQSLHTGMESIIRPPSAQTDKQMPPEDLRRIWEIGRLGVQETGYVLFSDHKLNDDVYAIHGDFGCWCYEFLGLVAFTVELWDLRARSGKDYLELSQFNKESDLDALEEVEVALLRWCDDTLDGEGFINWRPFDHPQLGIVEIGGWQRLLRNNAPPQLLEATCEMETRFLLAHAQASPRLRAEVCQVDALGDNVFRIAVAVRNDGYLPTQVTEQAVKMKKVRPVAARIELGQGDELILGNDCQELGQLDGYGAGGWRGDGVSGRQRRKVEWVVRFAHEPSARIEIHSQRAGTVRLELREEFAQR